MCRLAVFGGSGVIGRAALEVANADPAITAIHALQRRPIEPPLARVRYRQVGDFGDLGEHRDILTKIDAIIFALGVSQNAVSPAEYRRVTVDYALEAARCLAEANPNAAFVFVSSRGADPSGRSRFRFSRTKGEAERRLSEIALGRLVVARPAFVIPSAWPRAPSLADRTFMPIARLLGPLLPGWAMSSEEMGRALVNAAQTDTTNGVLDSENLRVLGTT
jgi:nucleoside-diphosphate-sugar epimerase